MENNNNPVWDFSETQLIEETPARRKLIFDNKGSSVNNRCTINSEEEEIVAPLSIQSVFPGSNIETNWSEVSQVEILLDERIVTSVEELSTDTLDAVPLSPEVIEEGTTSTVDIDDQYVAANQEQNQHSSTHPKKRKVQRTTSKDAPVRKRLQHSEKWLDNVAKAAKSKGLSYVTRSQKTVSERKLGQGCSSGCTLKCHNRITLEQRQDVFSYFWNLGDQMRKWNFIIRHTIVSDVKSHTTHWDSRRQKTRKYFLKVGGENIVVCKRMFLDTLNINDGWIRTALKKVNAEGLVSPDKRGKHSKRSQVALIRTEKMNSTVRDHIGMFSRVPSHYNRQNSQREYLRDGLSVAKMHSMYMEWWTSKEKTEEENQITPATERQYRDIFNTEFNIGFHRNKKDQCDTCVTWNNASEEEKERLRNTFEDHINNKTLARNYKENDKLDARADEKICMACFDLQKILNVPQGQSSAFFYKRALSVYNFTVFDCARFNGFCYIWNETIAKKGSTEVASCLLLFIEHMSKQGVSEFRFYSDNCGAQNRNRFVFATYLLAAVRFGVKIIHRFLEKGHTQNEGDSVHAAIERNSRRQDIYSQEEWCSVIKTARSGKHPYDVCELSQEQVFDVKAIINGQNWAKDDQGKKVAWSKVRELTVDSRKPFVVNFRYHFEENQRSMFISTVGPSVNLQTFKLQTAYKSKIPVPAAKVKDLLSLCRSGTIPTKYHSFYYSLVPNENDESEAENGKIGED